MKKEDQNVRSNWTKTPLVLGMAAVLSMPAAFSYANVSEGTRADVVQAVLQSRTIKGQILDENGEPLIGVSVVVKGESTVGTITDFDGNFSLEVPSGQKILVVSYIGYKTQEVTLGTGNTINVKMEPDTQALDEVVVIGYGTMKKRDLTGAITSVKSEDITLNPGSNPMEALQGKVAGLDITRTSGEAGAGVNLQLRGNRSFTASGTPLFIIDGMPGDYATLNPNDIESIEVLKDASSTAIYGASGANGVILITTKNGSAGKVAVNFNAYVGINGWSKTPSMRSGDSYINVLRDARKNNGDYTTDEALFTYAEEWQAHQKGQYIDWVDALLHTGISQNYSLSVSGGNEKTKAYMSLNYTDEQGQFEQDRFRLYSSKIRVDHNLRDWIKVGVDVQLSYVHQNRADSDLMTLMSANPLGSLYDEDGNIDATPLAAPNANTYNYLLNDNRDAYRNNQQNTKLYFNPYIEINPIKGLTFRSQVGVALNYSRSNFFYGEGSVQANNPNDANGGSYARVTDNRSYNYKWENILTYNFKIANDHDFTVTAVTSWNHNRSDVAQVYQSGIANNKYLWHNIQAGDSGTSGYTSYSMSKGMGYIGRLNYSYLGKYLFSASVRHDGSSRLAEGNKWDTFPAFSLGWRISEEKFMESTKDWLDNLKIRAGYGVTGTASINPYSSASSVENANIVMGGALMNGYIMSTNIPNLMLGWEKSHNTNVGIDASFLNNRIELTMDYYDTKTTDIIWTKQLPITNGGYNASTRFTTNVNIAESSNKGIELALTTRNIVNKDFTWTTNLTFNYNKEKINKLAGGDSDVISNGTTGYAYAIGEAVNSYYHYKLDGVWQESEADLAAIFNANPGDIKINVPNLVRDGNRFYKVDKKTGEPIKGDDGNIIYYDKENPYTIGGEDYQVLGHNSPDWSLGFQNAFTYKGFDLTVYAYARFGQMIKYDMLTSYDPTGQKNFPEYFVDHIGSYFPALNSGKALDTYDGWYALSYVDGSFFKIKNVTLGYTLPDNLVKKAGINKCRFYATITNPLVFAKSDLLKDYDPEMNGSLKYPLTKSFVFGVNLSF